MENRPNIVDWLTMVIAAGALLMTMVSAGLTYFDIRSRTEDIRLASALQKNDQKELCRDSGGLTGILADRLNQQNDEAIKYRP